MDKRSPGNHLDFSSVHNRLLPPRSVAEPFPTFDRHHLSFMDAFKISPQPPPWIINSPTSWISSPYFPDSVAHRPSTVPIDKRNIWSPGRGHHLVSSFVHHHPFPPQQIGVDRDPKPFPSPEHHQPFTDVREINRRSRIPHPHYDNERRRPSTDQPSVERNPQRPPVSFFDERDCRTFAEPPLYINHRPYPSIASEPQPTDSEQQQPRMMSAPLLGRYTWNPLPYPDFDRRTLTAPPPPNTERHTNASNIDRLPDFQPLSVNSSEATSSFSKEAPGLLSISRLMPYVDADHSFTSDPFALVSPPPRPSPYFMKQPFHLLSSRRTVIEDHARCESIPHAIETISTNSSPIKPKRKRD
mmetsp:Transcript_40542/g.67725  ORF Transcript_40542/g.67725 Transcript_40542/m.67725 type:complete len:356 (-) Transcript_40542:378-1445(-)